VYTRSSPFWNITQKTPAVSCRHFGTTYQSDLQGSISHNILGIWSLEERIAWSQNFNNMLKSTPKEHSRSRFNPIYIQKSYSFKILINAVFLPKIILAGGTRWHRWLRHCATSRKVAVSIPDGVIGIFQLHNPSGCTMVLGSTQTLTEISTRNISWR